MHDGPAKSSSKSNGTIPKREERVIPSDADGLPGENACPALADDNLTRHDGLPAEKLHTQPFPWSLLVLPGLSALLGLGHR